jgi:hypothetical protein
MSRDIATVIQNALGDDVIEPFFAVDLGFDSGTLRLWTGIGSKTINGEEYTGAGNFLQISEMQETAEIQAAGATLTLSGIPSELLSLALTEPYQQRPARIYFGLFNRPVWFLSEGVWQNAGIWIDSVSWDETSSGTIFGDIVSLDMAEVFTARMDQMTIEEGPETCTVQLTIENILVDLERARVLRYTNNDQQSRFPGDRGLEFVESLQNKELFWGRVPK